MWQIIGDGFGLYLVMQSSHWTMHSVIKKSLYTWWLQYRKLQVMCKVSPSSLQTFIDTLNCVLKDRVQYSTVHILNVFCDDHLKIINCVGIVLYCTCQVHRDFLITLYYMILTMPSVAFNMPATEHHFYRMLVKSNSNWWSHLTYINVLKQTTDRTDF
jgi:hypothetical protein